MIRKLKSLPVGAERNLFNEYYSTENNYKHGSFRNG